MTQMHLVAMVNPPTSQYAENWRHPLSRTDWLSGRFFTDLARILERGCFDMMFFADALAVPEDRHGEYATTLRTAGKGSIYFDPVTLISHVAAATTHLGLGATVSTSFVPPYAIARQLLSVDHLSGGRVAWNIVTSTTNAEARNMGHAAIASPTDRYDHADSVVEAVRALWQSWEPDALVLDQASGEFVDADRVHRIPAGLGSRGPLTLPSSSQREPVLMQAGSSPRGRDFAARWAEVVFAIGDSAEQMRELRTELRERAQRDYGRDPDSIRVLQGVQPIVGSTDAAAAAKLAELRAAIDLPAAVTKLERLLHADSLDLAASAVDVLDAHRGATGSTGFEDMLRAVSERRSFTVADLALEQAMNQLHPQLVGSPASIADELEHLFRTEAADGFIIFPALYHASFEDFVNGVVPELQRRGVFRQSYAHSTLRGTLGMS
ncbi:MULTISPECIES: NtaA/DmoA family FMN-dependent monooxygenase [unclassified Leucobacter]|uniref:NtaA/DmoA family FMN-dependent monooxygenase n=1 Tax=unclassified Leucobacter TaxID=2621730 RepID=UPI0020416D55|nr:MULTISPECIES: NtaA/DmoA family FMN-dependent monooxygenase [unclassified Leucobacter]